MRNYWNRAENIEAIFGRFFTMERVLSRIGSDKQFVAFIRLQEPCFGGTFEEYKDGSPRAIPAHVRRARNSGTGYKPKYSCIPLTDRQHRLQHQKGESAIAPKEEWDRMADVYRQKWALHVLKEKLGLTSATGATMEDLLKISGWVHLNDLGEDLKRESPYEFPYL